MPAPAYGWAADGTIVEEAAAQLQQMADEVIAGKSLAGIVRRLDAEQVPTPSSSGRWAPITIRRALTSPRIVGDREGVPPILDRGRYDQVVEILQDPARRKFAPKSAEPTSWLSGLVRCARCGQTMYAQGPDLKCSKRGSEAPGCGRTSVRRAAVEAHTEALIVARLGNREWRKALAEQVARVDELRATVEDADARIVVLSETFGGGKTDQAAFESGVAEAQKVRDAAAARLDRVDAVAAALSFGDVVDWWAELPTERRKRIAGALLEKVMVRPKSERTITYESLTFPTEERLEYEWR